MPGRDASRSGHRLLKNGSGCADSPGMSTSAHETMPAPTLPPPTGTQVPDLPPPPIVPLADAELPRLAVTPRPGPAATAHPPVTMLLPGSAAELPRLGEPGTVTPAPRPVTSPDLPADVPALPDAGTPVPPASAPPVIPTQMTPPDAAGGQRPVAETETAAGGDDQTGQRNHPMAHLMGTIAPATEASKRAAAARAEMKQRAKKIKIAVITGLVAVTAAAVIFVGPWLVDAVNEAGGTSGDPGVGSVEQP